MGTLGWCLNVPVTTLVTATFSEPVQEATIVFELRDDVLLNYGTVGVKSITLMPARLSNIGKVEQRQ